MCGRWAGRGRGNNTCRPGPGWHELRKSNLGVLLPAPKPRAPDLTSRCTSDQITGSTHNDRLQTQTSTKVHADSFIGLQFRQQCCFGLLNKYKIATVVSVCTLLGGWLSGLRETCLAAVFFSLLRIMVRVVVAVLWRSTLQQFKYGNNT